MSARYRLLFIDTVSGVFEVGGGCGCGSEGREVDKICMY